VRCDVGIEFGASASGTLQPVNLDTTVVDFWLKEEGDDDGSKDMGERVPEPRKPIPLGSVQQGHLKGESFFIHLHNLNPHPLQTLKF